MFSKVTVNIFLRGNADGIEKGKNEGADSDFRGQRWQRKSQLGAAAGKLPGAAAGEA